MPNDKRIVDYMFVQGTVEYIHAEVRKFIRLGWQPYGPLIVVGPHATEPAMCFCRELVKYE